MNNKNLLLLLTFSIFIVLACNKNSEVTAQSKAYRITKNISYNNVPVTVVIDKPENDTMDVLVVYHGTVLYDNKIVEAANNTLNEFKRILNRTNMMIVSVAYPEEGLLMGDNVRESEAAFLWIKNNAANELGISIKKIFLGGHSQGGYIVTRLNTMHATNGVIANGPGPLNLVYRCQLEENQQIASGVTCTLLKNTYGTTTANPTAYYNRSLLNFTSNYKSPILFVQGLNDTPIQLNSWPVFKQQVTNCTSCASYQFLDIPNYGHTALFDSPDAKQAFNSFINQ